jgi:hypothetical protein
MAESFNQNAKQIKADFDRDGYVVIRSFLNPGEVVALQRELDRYVNVVAPKLPATDVMYEDKQNPQTLKQLAAEMGRACGNLAGGWGGAAGIGMV